MIFPDKIASEFIGDRVARRCCVFCSLAFFAAEMLFRRDRALLRDRLGLLRRLARSGFLRGLGGFFSCGFGHKYVSAAVSLAASGGLIKDISEIAQAEICLCESGSDHSGFARCVHELALE